MDAANVRHIWEMLETLAWRAERESTDLGRIVGSIRKLDRSCLNSANAGVVSQKIRLGALRTV